jgi:hypothetical protein
MNGVTLMLDPRLQTALLQRAPTPAPLGARLSCAQGQAVAFLAAGRVAGVLGPGEHVLDPHALPFLGPIVQQRPGGPVLGDDLVWVKSGDPVMIEATGAFATIQDATLGERVTPRFVARARVTVADALRALSAPPGQGGPEQRVKTELAEEVARAASGARGLVEVTQPERWPELAAAATAALGPRLGELGLRLFGVELAAVSVPDDVAARLRLLAAGSTQLRDAPAAPLVLSPGARVRVSQVGRWHSGAVVEIAGDECDVLWDVSGARTRVSMQSLEAEPHYPGAHAAGTRVLAQSADGGYYPATVRVFNGTVYEVVWDQGGSAWLSPGQIRI